MINKTILVGHAGADPEIRHTQDGTAVATFNIATTEVWKDRAGERQERTDWHRVVAWAALADMCGKFVRKGSRLYVEGSTHTRDYEDRDGVHRFVTEVKAQTVKLLDRREAQHPPTPARPAGRPMAPALAGDDFDEFDEFGDELGF